MSQSLKSYTKEKQRINFKNVITGIVLLSLAVGAGLQTIFVAVVWNMPLSWFFSTRAYQVNFWGILLGATAFFIGLGLILLEARKLK